MTKQVKRKDYYLMY